MAKKGGLADALWSLPWIVNVILVIFADCVFGVCRFVDGILEKNILKLVVGFLWIFYGLGIGWILDIICVVLKKRPILF